MGSWEEAEREAGFPLKASRREGSTEGRSRADPGIQGSKHSLPLTQQQGCHPWKAATSDTAVISQQSSRGAHPHLLCSQCLGSAEGMEVTPGSCAQGISPSLLWNSRRQHRKEGEHSKAQKGSRHRHPNCSHFESAADLPCFHQHFSCFSIGMKCWHKREKRVEVSQRKVQNRARCQFTIRHQQRHRVVQKEPTTGILGPFSSPSHFLFQPFPLEIENHIRQEQG